MSTVILPESSLSHLSHFEAEWGKGHVVMNMMMPANSTMWTVVTAVVFFFFFFFFFYAEVKMTEECQLLLFNEARVS